MRRHLVWCVIPILVVAACDAPAPTASSKVDSLAPVEQLATDAGATQGADTPDALRVTALASAPADTTGDAAAVVAPADSGGSMNLAAANQAPVANAGGPYTGVEGSPVTFSAAGSSDPDGDVLSYQWTIEAPCSPTTMPGVDCSKYAQPTVDHAFARNGSYVATVQVSDANGGTSSASAQATIANAAPVISAFGLPENIAPGSSATLSVTFSDPGIYDSPWQFFIRWGDFAETGGQAPSFATPITINHLYTTAGRYNVSIMIVDRDGAYVSQSRVLVVGATGNTGTGSNVRVVPVDATTGGTPVAVTFASVTTAGATSLVTSQGAAPAVTGLRSPNPATLYTVASTAQFTGTLTVCISYDPARFNNTSSPRLLQRESDGSWSDITSSVDPQTNTVCGVTDMLGVFAIAMQNQAPVAAIAPAAGNEGAPIVLDASASSDPDGDVLTYEWSFGDGSSQVTPTPTVSHAYGDNGSYTLSVITRDPDGLASAPAVQHVVVANVAPAATLNVPGPQPEGGSFQIALTQVNDPSAADHAAGYSFAFDCGAGFGAWGSSASTSCPAVDDGMHTVRGRVRDKDGGEQVVTAMVDVTNVAPTLGPLTGPSKAQKVGTTVTVSASVTDPGVQDQFTVRIEWGDGTVGSGVVSGGVASGTHAYTAPGLYTVSMRVLDDDGGQSALSVLNDVAIFDPSEGWLNGAGHVDFPLPPSTKMTMTTKKTSASLQRNVNERRLQRLHFSVMARYRRERLVEDELNGFEVSSDNVSLRSRSIDWFVISGATATLKGTAGLPKGPAAYGYLLVLVDGGRARDRKDRMRLKVWNLATQEVLFDTQPGDPDSAAPTALVKAGSVRVHNRERPER